MIQKLRGACLVGGANGPAWRMAILVWVACVVSGTLGLAQEQDQAPRSPNPASVRGVLRVQTVASGLENPWGLAFLPDGRLLVTERPGRVASSNVMALSPNR